MSTPGKWFKVEAFGFIPEGGELLTDLTTQRTVANGIGALGFAVVDGLTVSMVLEDDARVGGTSGGAECPNCGRTDGDKTTEKCYLC